MWKRNDCCFLFCPIVIVVGFLLLVALLPSFSFYSMLKPVPVWHFAIIRIYFYALNQTKGQNGSIDRMHTYIWVREWLDGWMRKGLIYYHGYYHACHSIPFSLSNRFNRLYDVCNAFFQVVLFFKVFPFHHSPSPSPCSAFQVTHKEKLPRICWKCMNKRT